MSGESKQRSVPDFFSIHVVRCGEVAENLGSLLICK